MNLLTGYEGKGNSRARDHAVISSPGGWAHGVPVKEWGSQGEASICVCKIINSILNKECL